MALKVLIGRRVVRFPASMTPEAMRFARDMSDRRGTWIYATLDGPGGGIVGQYFKGATSREFRAHDRAAGLRSPVLGFGWNKIKDAS